MLRREPFRARSHSRRHGTSLRRRSAWPARCDVSARLPSRAARDAAAARGDSNGCGGTLRTQHGRDRVDAPARLTYVDAGTPGIRRVRRGDRFVYLDPEGRQIRERAEIARINKLAIPPAYCDVWICPDPNGHLQATGRDAKGRKQYRYHPAWIAARDTYKYCRMLGFGRALPKIRAATAAHLDAPGLSADKVMATVVALLEQTLIRVGNTQYARENASFGLTTLQDRHVAVRGSAVQFRFTGKSGVKHRHALEHPRLARILKRCQDLPGQQLFQYLDAHGNPRPVTSNDVNTYLKTHGGGDFTAKDYRTWAGSALALALFRRLPWRDRRDAEKQITAVIDQVAAQLGNTPAVCRKCYVHPAVVDAFVAGTLGTLPRRRRRKHLSADEAALLAFLETHHDAHCA